MNIIIVDDDCLVVDSLKTIVEASGINVLSVGYNGLEAIDLYVSFRLI